MKSPLNHRWPTKLKKFGITDPFLKILVTKYEREIPWQEVVKDSETLNAHVRDEMLPKLLARVQYPPEKMSKSMFVTRKHLNLETALTYEEGLNYDGLSDIKEILSKNGELAATDSLIEQINRRKEKAFKIWIARLQKNYPNEPGFQLLVLRSMFELSGKGNRRPLFEPSDDIIDWLHRRISRERFSPFDNIARQYCMKLGAGSRNAVLNGWIYVPGDRKNAAKLAALSRGSGWCVAGQSWATGYLHESHFYILYADGKPVVALRQGLYNDRIIECEGRYNESPLEWFQDIQLFLETRGLELLHREDEMDRALDRLGNIDLMVWWQERIGLWPFAVFFAPEPFWESQFPNVKAAAVYYADFPDFDNLKNLVGLPSDLDLDQDYWCELVEINPYLYDRCPEKYRLKDDLTKACINGWLEKLADDDITLAEMDGIPEFVTETQPWLEGLRSNFPSALRERIRRLRSTREERENPFRLDEVLPGIPDEAATLVLERMVNILLNNEDGIFSDSIFPALIRNREDFQELRLKAWLSSIQAHPPFWFALPDDLKSKNEFQPVDKISKRVDLETWCEMVQKKPWLLTQKNGVPRTIRHHRRILENYRDGWIPYLREYPWQIWIERGLCNRRVYMSYALLADETVLKALTFGWKHHTMEQQRSVWEMASSRTQTMPPIQLSMLRAIDEVGPSRFFGGCSHILKRVQLMHNLRFKSREPDDPVSIELKELLRTLSCSVESILKGRPWLKK